MYEVQVQLEIFEQQKELKKRQREMAAIGGTEDSSSIAPFHFSSVNGGCSVSMGPRVCASRLDSYILPHTAPSSQLSIESTGWNKDKHDVAKSAIGDVWFCCNIPFHADSLHFLYGKNFERAMRILDQGGVKLIIGCRRIKKQGSIYMFPRAPLYMLFLFL
ncbi:uncharacterized protein LOC131060550 isoform X2 [Cryptomeria japonica]|uniref:uncharacterized protein LOC131060550 isoform X2 n=1 Tax=Cryptomeria japonica TaxID=3369 RepID=UPI0027DA6FFB|nr:uncharacterized protein LOC131060550 isoform X2 [Cryptomeria japonica]